jgi:hypothetical protein
MHELRVNRTEASTNHGNTALSDRRLRPKIKEVVPSHATDVASSITVYPILLGFVEIGRNSCDPDRYSLARAGVTARQTRYRVHTLKYGPVILLVYVHLLDPPLRGSKSFKSQVSQGS